VMMMIGSRLFSNLM